MISGRMRLRFLALGLLLLGTACRFGFDPSAGEFNFSVSGDSPFGGAAAEGLDFAPQGARLSTLAGFGLLGERLPAPVASASAAALGEHFLVSGGTRVYQSASDCSSDMLLLDPAGGPLAFAGRLPFAKQGAGLMPTSEGALLHLMGYCGESSDEESKVLRNLQPAQVFLEIGRFPVPAYHFSAATVTGAAGQEHLLVAGGYGCGPLTAAIQYMATGDGSASRAAIDLPSARCLAAGTGSGDELLLFGGSGHTDCNPPRTVCSNPLLDEIVAVGLAPERVEVIGHLPEPLADACAVTRQDGSVLVFGGLRYDPLAPCDILLEASDAVYLFDPDSGQVSKHPDRLPQPRAGMACAINDADRIVLFGGSGADWVTTDEILVFEPFAPEGSLTGQVIDARVPDVRWTTLELDTDSPPGTTIEAQVRISSSPPTEGVMDWLAVEPGPLPDSLPRGRYFQWRLELRSASPLSTPLVRDVLVRYQSD